VAPAAPSGLCATVQRLERNAGKGCDQLPPVDVSRFLADPDLGASSRAAYFGSISAFCRWWATQGGTNITARLAWPLAEAIAAAGVGAGPIMKQYVAVLKDPI
jgi:hypothetical protein